ncbi:MAG TPA: exodeoxyribonuclease VII large subunit [Bacteroidota bacterium]|nr:exodeoxyribonuclease VII large subunit [Bacteroidota bacterium]
MRVRKGSVLAAGNSAADTPLSVSAVTHRIKDTLESGFGELSVVGEISNLVRHASGHWYFTLKDANAQLAAVMFRANASTMFFIPDNGMEVLCSGRLTVYEARGQYQLLVRAMKPRGEGALQVAFEQLKRRLHAEGLFDESRKRPLPRFPRTVALVTSPGGAAIRDMISVMRRRDASVQLLIVPVPVQGAGAAERIAEAIDDCNAYGAIDVIVTGRGGGSIEDLWAFNEEVVARAIARSAIPVVSAVGHEIDITIADYVADLRAATPSVAGELVLPSAREVVEQLRGIASAAGKSVLYLLHRRIEALRSAMTERALRRLDSRFDTMRQMLDERASVLHREMERRLERSRHAVQLARERLGVHDPAKLFQRGAAFVRSGSEVVTSIAQLRPGALIQLRFRDGHVVARVEEMDKDGGETS